MLRHSLRLTVICALVLAAPILAANTRVRAQDNAGDEDRADSMQAPREEPEPIPADGSAGTGDPSLADEQALQSEGDNRPEAERDSTDPFEDPHEGYYFVGLMYRHIVVPKFIQNLFVDGGTTVSNPGFGAQFEYRKDNFSIIGNVWWQDFGFVGPYRAPADVEGDTEMINSTWSSVFLSASFLWSTPLSDIFAIEYGIDVGLGAVFGDGVRTEAFSNDGGDNYAACSGPGDPRDTSGVGYCGSPSVADGENGEHYGVVARKWSDGSGSVPNIVPWLGIPHIALRIKPIHQVQIRIDAGFFGGFWFGAGLSYGI